MRGIFLITFFCSFLLSMAQNIGGFSPKLEWKIIDKEDYRILFHPLNKSSAIEFGHYFQTLSANNKSIGDKRKKIPLVLRHQHTIPNGFVAFTPFRSEIYTTPHPNNFVLGSLDWNYLLALHEYQHVLQMSNSLNGISKWSYFFGGEIFWSSVLGTSVPNWFFEGEAVRAETEMSQQGRWRIPNFFNGYRQMAYEDNFYSFDVARNGSFRKDVPDHYRLGSILVGYAKDMSDGMFWKTVFHEASAYKSALYPFGRALKRNSGNGIVDFYKKACQAFRNSIPEVNKIDYPLAWSVFQKDDLSRESMLTVDNYDSTYYYRYTSNDEIPALIKIEKGSSKKVLQLPFQIDQIFDIYDHQLITSATYVHPRWNQVSYQDLVTYDLNTNKSTRLTSGGRYFSPIWFEDGKSIISIKVNDNGKCKIVLLDSLGIEKKVFKNDSSYFISYPKVLSNETLVVNLRHPNGKNCLALFDLEQNSFESITRWNYHQTGIPVVHNDSILFSASFDGIDHIYLYHNKQLEQLTFGREPHYMPRIKSNRLYFQAYSLKESRYKSILLSDINSTLIHQIGISPKSPFSINDSLVIEPFQSKMNSDSLSAYQKGKHLFQLHSWTPIIEDPIFKLEMTAEDVLGTFRGKIAGRYNSNENRFGQEVSLIYGQYSTIFNLRVKNQARRLRLLNQGRISFNETEVSLGTNWPLNFTSGIYQRRLNIESNIAYKTFYEQSESRSTEELWSTSFSQHLKLSKRRALKNISSPLALSLNWKQSLSIEDKINQLKFFNSFSSKGLFQNHNLIFDLDLQFQENPRSYAFEDDFFVSRGYKAFQHDFQSRIGINYHFPIAYPDFGFFGILYIYRLRGNAFMDIGRVGIGDIKADLISAGTELIFDMNVLNQFPMSFGIRYIRINENVSLARGGNTNQIELFFPISRFN